MITRAMNPTRPHDSPQPTHFCKDDEYRNPSEHEPHRGPRAPVWHKSASASHFEMLVDCQHSEESGLEPLHVRRGQRYRSRSPSKSLAEVVLNQYPFFGPGNRAPVLS